METRHPNHAFPTCGIAVTSDIMDSETSMQSPNTSKWFSVRFKAKCKDASQWNPSSRSKNSSQPAAWKMARTAGFFLSSYVSKGSWRAGIPIVLAADWDCYFADYRIQEWRLQRRGCMNRWGKMLSKWANLESPAQKNIQNFIPNWGRWRLLVFTSHEGRS